IQEILAPLMGHFTPLSFPDLQWMSNSRCNFTCLTKSNNVFSEMKSRTHKPPVLSVHSGQVARLVDLKGRDDDISGR
ncbi:hypothetical protein BgiMline_003372, partial [Biomphalaria glabrata]